MGIAFLQDGTKMDYDEYIDKHPHWQKVRKARFDFDGGRCVVCHSELSGKRFDTHHLNYTHLGNEHMTDVITLCPRHHIMFHNVWCRQRFWKGHEPDHWDAFDIWHTARMCIAYEGEDMFLSKNAENPNLCNRDVARQYVDKYFTDFELEKHPILDPNDFTLYIRNKRYEQFFEAEKRGLTVEQFLDECFGEKVRGKNPIRQLAGKKNGAYDHTPESFHKHYSENKNLNILMDKVNELKEEKTNAET